MTSVTSLAVFPIKGCGGIELERATLGTYGLVGDREWQVVADEEFVTQRTHPRLATVRPALAEGGVLLRADGMADLFVERPARADRRASTYSGPVQVGDAGDTAAAWFSDLLGDAVRLVGIAPGYERATGLFATESNLGDVAPVLLVNEASHRFLAERATEPFGLDRWRANIIVDAGEPFVEDTWRAVRLGDATLTLVYPWPRCAVPQVDQVTGERHREPAIVLKRHRWCTSIDSEDAIATMMLPGSALFGMGAAIEPAGATITVGDGLDVLDTSDALLPFSGA
jgi:uncharacterized protein YcbX